MYTQGGEDNTGKNRHATFMRTGLLKVVSFEDSIVKIIFKFSLYVIF
jgi:hypothetical protein